MFFTKIGKALAYAGFVFGILYTAYAFWFGFSGQPEFVSFDNTRNYLRATGVQQAINQGFMVILVSVALGILCEISSNQKGSGDE